MAFSDFLDPVLGWVLTMPLWAGLLILAFFLTLVINVVYKYATDQKEMKRLKTKIKSFQKEMKEHKDDPKKLQKLQREAMSTNMQYTMKSLKPTLYTFIPLIIIFAWMNANLAYEVVDPQELVEIQVEMVSPAELEFASETLSVEGDAVKETIESQASWQVSGEAGIHDFTITALSENNASTSHRVVVGDQPDEPSPAVDEPFESLEVGYGKAKPFGSFSIFGYNPGWLFTYIIFSIALSLGMRKVMRIH